MRSRLLRFERRTDDAVLNQHPGAGKSIASAQKRILQDLYKAGAIEARVDQRHPPETPECAPATHRRQKRTPGVGIVILGTILADIGVPAGGIALVIGVDRILDMSRTVVNVTGDLTACLVLERWVGDALSNDTRTASVIPDELPAGSGVPTSSRSAEP